MLNWTRVIELRDEIGAEDFAEVVELFLDEAGEVLDRLSPGTGAAQLEEDLHFLKGAALNLGFAGLAALCLQGEKAARAGRPQDVDIDGLRQTFATDRDGFLDRAVAEGFVPA